jgi:hypothetical protein
MPAKTTGLESAILSCFLSLDAEEFHRFDTRMIRDSHPLT